MRTIFETGAIDSLDRHLAPLGSTTVLFLVSPRRRFVDRATAGAGNRKCVVFDEARVHVPVETVDKAAELVRDHGVDTIVAIGGGAAVGLGKALCLDNDLHFVAVPTTYSGSEQTNIYGVRTGGEKRTGRDDRVRPDLVVYDASLTTALPRTLTAQSLCNSLAQVISARSTDSLDDTEALDAAAEIWRAMTAVTTAPTSVEAREQALRAACRAGRAIDRGTLGAQHKLAHAIGGHFDLEHSAVHSILLPSFMAHLRRRGTSWLEAVDDACGREELEASVYDVLREVGAPVSLRELEVHRSAVAELLDRSPALPRDVAWDAYYGIRPSHGATFERSTSGEPLSLHWGPKADDARRTILALHGRGANIGRMLRDVRLVTGGAKDVAIVALQAPDCSWYPKPYSRSVEEHGADLETALARVNAALDQLSKSCSEEALAVFGFSQGACLSVEVVARRGGAFAAVMAICGARIGEPGSHPPSASLDGVPVLLGAADHDPWLEVEDIRATAAQLEAAGARVVLALHAGNEHAITDSQRQHARRILEIV